MKDLGMPRNGATYDSDSDSSSSGSDPVGANRREDRDQETSERENDIGDNYGMYNCVDKQLHTL
eukprot:1362805-Amorphochlora_amoeboformis.AAC.1